MDTLKSILTAQDIADYLEISRKTVYELMKTKVSVGGLPSINIGSSKRVFKKDFIIWLDARKNYLSDESGEIYANNSL